MSDEEVPSGGGYFEDYPDVDRHSCRLLGPTALIVQGLMGIIVILSLVYKRHREKPHRPWRIWLFDVSKQIIGQLFVHGFNLVASSLFSRHSDSNACTSYFLNILVDTTLGVGLLYFILRIFNHTLTEKLHYEGFQSGFYGNPPSIFFWLRQAAIYVLALTTMKFVVVAMLALFPGLDRIAAWLLSWTWSDEGDSVQVIFVMGIFPIIMNVLQFWLIDSIVKASNEALGLETDDGDEFDGSSRQPLFRTSTDDEGDDGSRPPYDIENPPEPNFHIDIPKLSSSSVAPSEEFKPNMSGATTPKDTDVLELHEYPPSLSSSMSSTASTSTAPKSIREATKLNKKRRSPPAALNIQTAHQPAINSPQSQEVIAPQPKHVTQKSADWNSWADSDDWADRVGEEDWTGRRAAEKNSSIHSIWNTETELH